MQYFRRSNLSGDAFNGTCNAIIELFTERSHSEMVDKMFRGGVSASFEKPYFKANNSYLESSHPKEANTLPMLVYAIFFGRHYENMSLTFEQLRTILYIELDILKNPVDSDFGYTLELDLPYPDELHDAQIDFPVAPTKEILLY